MLNTKNMIYGIAAAGLLATSMNSTAIAADATANASATVGAPIVINLVKALNFGSFAPNASTPGSVVLNHTTGTATYNVVTALAGSTPSEGEFLITGQGNAAVTIVIPSTAQTLTNQDGPGTMSVNTFTSDAPASFDGSGNITLNLGATLTVAAAQNAGNYTGTYDVSVNYQ